MGASYTGEGVTKNPHRREGKSKNEEAFVSNDKGQAISRNWEAVCPETVETASEDGPRLVKERKTLHHPFHIPVCSPSVPYWQNSARTIVGETHNMPVESAFL